jgi:hypothetical protein
MSGRGEHDLEMKRIWPRNTIVGNGDVGFRMT